MTAVAETLVDRMQSVDWTAVESSLETHGFARLPAVLAPDECDALSALYTDEHRFRSRIDMARFRFGAGEYKYFTAPLPEIVRSLRKDLYGRLAPIANRWTVRLVRPAGRPEVRLKPDTTDDSTFDGAVGDRPYPPRLDDFLARCHHAGQTRPTPLLLSYKAGGYNCLHQDIYGDLAFPLQAVFVLSRAGTDYSGGEFLLVEQRPRAQSRGHALRIDQGSGIVFATRERPVAGTRGDYRVVMRHGVSTITNGARMSLGIIFHDAR
jgi:uncharacterized protein